MKEEIASRLAKECERTRLPERHMRWVINSVLSALVAGLVEEGRVTVCGLVLGSGNEPPQQSKVRAFTKPPTGAD